MLPCGTGLDGVARREASEHMECRRGGGAVVREHLVCAIEGGKQAAKFVVGRDDLPLVAQRRENLCLCSELHTSGGVDLKRSASKQRRGERVDLLLACR